MPSKLTMEPLDAPTFKMPTQQPSGIKSTYSGSLRLSAPSRRHVEKKRPPEDEIIPDSEEERLRGAGIVDHVLMDDDSDVQIVGVSHTKRPQPSVIVISSSEEENDTPQHARGPPSGSEDFVEAGPTRLGTRNKGRRRAPIRRIESEDSETSVICISSDEEDEAALSPPISPVKYRILKRKTTPYAPTLDADGFSEPDPAILTFDPHVMTRPIPRTPGPKPRPRPKATASAPATPRKPKVVSQRQVELEEYTRTLFAELNETVFARGMPPETELVWNKKFATTAGRAVWTKNRHGVTSSTIELSPKVVDCEERVRNTLAHEMCHLAVWVLDSEPNEQGHGRRFKAWSARVTKARPDIKIRTKHVYEINYPYNWECEDCGKVYGRHSKSIDTAKQRCGVCKLPGGYLKPLFPTRPKRTPKPMNKSRLASDSPRDSPRLADRPPRSPTKLSIPGSADEDEVEDLVKGLDQVAL